MQAILFFVLLFPFFQPMSINLLVENVNKNWKLLDYGYDGAKMVFASVGYMVWLYNRSRKSPDWMVLLICNLAALALASVMNGSGTVNVLRRYYVELGFAVLVSEMIQEAPKTFLRAAVAVFAVYTIWGVLTIYLFPYGFFKAETVYDAIYGLGAKNNSFPFFFALFFFMIAENLERTGKITIGIVVLVLLTIIAGVICESVNTILCLLMVIAVVVLAVYVRPLLTAINVKVLFLVLVLIMVCIYSGTQFNVVGSLLKALGRSATFSGRSVLWEQALQHLRENPLFGAGVDTIFTLASGVQTPHAHSQWMDKLAKYGLLPAMFVSLTIYLTFHRIRKHTDQYQATVYGLLLLIYLFHMSFDTYNYNFFTMFLIVINSSLYPPTSTKLHSGADSTAA